MDTFTYSWSIEQQVGPSWNIAALPPDADTTSPTFAYTPTDNGVYRAVCTIRDNAHAAVVARSSSVTVLNANPTGGISGQPDGNINEGDTVSLSVAAGDPGAGDRNSLTYSWSVKKGEGDL